MPRGTAEDHSSATVIKTGSSTDKGFHNSFLPFTPDPSSLLNLCFILKYRKGGYRSSHSTQK